MHNLLLEEGDIVQIESVSLPVAKYSKFQPQTVEFLDITNPKAVLENCLRNFACLTTGDLIAIKYNNYAYELSVLETKPGPAVTIIECDMNVEFAPPVGYTEPTKKPKQEEPMAVDPSELMPEPAGFIAFKGTGSRLDGKKKKEGSVSESAPVHRADYVRGIPDYGHPFGLLRFDRTVRKVEATDGKNEEDPFEAFKGEGFSLKKSRK